MGGNAFPDVGAICIYEIAPTLNKLATMLGLSLPLTTLGSVGKKDFSGDIDIALNIPPEEQRAFFEMLKTHFGDHDVRKFGNCISVPMLIETYSERSSRSTDRPRTGKVQVDFIFGDPQWLSFFFHSSDNSKFKGTHRNIAISSLAGHTDRIEHSDEIDSEGRCADVSRWKWSSKTGLSYVRRTSRRNEKTGKWIKKQTETVITGSITDPSDIASALFKTDKFICLNDKYFDSAETICDAINIVYGSNPMKKEQIFEQIAYNYSVHHDISKQEWDYPDEIKRHLDEIVRTRQEGT